MKEGALQEGLPVLEEAAVREQVLGARVEAPRRATMKDHKSEQDRGSSSQ